MKQVYIEKWDDGRYWEKNQDAIVKHAVWRLLKDHDDKVECDKILVTRAKLEELTKAPQTLINKLIKDKVFIDNGNKIILEVNMKQFYCHRCEEQRQIKNITEKRTDIPEKLYEWELDKHLRTDHYLGYHYDNATKVQDPIPQEKFDEYFRTKLPKFVTCEHTFKVTKIDNSNLDTVTIELVCKNCKYDTTVYRHNVQTCTKEIF